MLLLKKEGDNVPKMNQRASVGNSVKLSNQMVPEVGKRTQNMLLPLPSVTRHDKSHNATRKNVSLKSGER